MIVKMSTIVMVIIMVLVGEVLAWCALSNICRSEPDPEFSCYSYTVQESEDESDYRSYGDDDSGGESGDEYSGYFGFA